MMNFAKIGAAIAVASVASACTATAPGETVLRDSKILRASDRTITGSDGVEYRSGAIVFKRIGSVTVFVDNPKVKSIRRAKRSQSVYLDIANAEGKRLCNGVRKRARSYDLPDRTEFRKRRGRVALIKRVYC